MEQAFVKNDMMVWCLSAVFIMSLAITGLLIPKILLIAYRKNLFDIPDARKIHTSRVPRLGGIAFVPAIIISIAMIFGLSESDTVIRSGDIAEPSMPFGICGLLLLYITGISDDLIGERYKAKLAMQIAAAGLMLCSGLCICNLHGFWGIYDWPQWSVYILTALVVVFIVNAINLIDGIDGLASGLSAVACAFFGVVFACSGNTFHALLSFATLGTIVPFFYYNVFGNEKMRRKIFMGDTGSLCIGFILAYLAVSMSDVHIRGVFSGFNPIVVAFSPLLVPCLDVLRVFIHRLRFHRSPFMPDCSHIHHKLLALGLSAPKAMAMIIAISAILVAVNVLLSASVNVTYLLAGDIGIWILFNIALTRRILHLRHISRLPSNGSFL